MTPAFTHTGTALEQAIKEEARRLGFVLAGVTTPDPPPHALVFETWLGKGMHGSMSYLSQARSRLCRGDPRELMADCRSILVLAVPYFNPNRPAEARREHRTGGSWGRVAAYAWGRDYHEVLPTRLRTLVDYIQQKAGKPVAARYYTDTGPILERDLAQRAGLGWIGKNTCLINPRLGSYLLLAEILLDLELMPDPPIATDHCGSCSRCIEACPTGCILENRTIDARRCISYLTIEIRDAMPIELRPAVGDWVFGCDVCQMVCPWNRFAPERGDEAFAPRHRQASPALAQDLRLSPEEYSEEFKGTAIRRAKHVGYLRNLAVAAGNIADPLVLPALRAAGDLSAAIIREHVAWAIQQIEDREHGRA